MLRRFTRVAAVPRPTLQRATAMPSVSRCSSNIGAIATTDACRGKSTCDTAGPRKGASPTRPAQPPATGGVAVNPALAQAPVTTGAQWATVSELLADSRLAFDSAKQAAYLDLLQTNEYNTIEDVKDEKGPGQFAELSKLPGRDAGKLYNLVSATDPLRPPRFAEEAKRAVASLVESLNDSFYWSRPTPRPAELYRVTPLYWPGTANDCSNTKLPFPRELDADGRTCALGIGNAFGTGKTEVAVNGAEVTAEQEAGVEVAYMSFSNGYRDAMVLRTVRDTSVVDSVTGKAWSKYTGLWLLAAKAATRIVDRGGGKKEVQGNPILFQSIISFYLNHEHWPLPDYSSEAHCKLVVIIDEVQVFSYDQLDGFLSNHAVNVSTRMTLVVGAFNPTFASPSGLRMADMQYPILSLADMESLFKRHVLKGRSDALLRFNGVNLPSLFGGALRPIVNAAQVQVDLFEHRNPVDKCKHLFKKYAYYRRTPGPVFRACVADVPVSSEWLLATFKSDTMSLGSAYLSNSGNLASMKVQTPPLLVAGNAVELIDVVDEESGETCTAVLSDFTNPNWRKFEALSTVAPALRLAALSATGMDFATGGRTALQLLFSSAQSTKPARDLMSLELLPNLRVRCVHGGMNLAVLDDLDRLKSPREIVRIDMSEDHDSPFDGYLLVPVKQDAKTRYVLLCCEAKFSAKRGGTAPDEESAVEEPERYLNDAQDVKPKIALFRKRGVQQRCPDDVVPCLVIITNRHTATKVKRRRGNVPIIVCSRPHLKDCFSSCLVPPKFRN